VESALERQLSVAIIDAKPRFRRLQAGRTLVQQGEQGEELFLLFDGVLRVEVDGNPMSEVSPGAILGELALLQDGDLVRLPQLVRGSGRQASPPPSDTTVLGWFQRMWASTAAVVDIDDEWEAHQWVAERIAAELGDEVYGLDSVFVEAHDHGIPPPATWQELGAVLTEHLYVEHEVRVDEHSVRASTDDDTIYLAYYCFDDTLAYARPDRAAWLLHQTWELPSDTGPGEPFQPVVPVRPLLPAGDGEGATYVVLPVDDDVLWYERRRPWVLPGVRLPQLAGWLRLVAPAVTEIRGRWEGAAVGLRDRPES
jgi:Cyclic nucleotide-binding domain